MTFVCLWSPRWETAAAPLADLAVALLEHVPRVAVDGAGMVWADVRGLPAPRLAWELRARALEAMAGPAGPEIHAGVAAVPVAAEVAARAAESPVTFVEPAHERAFLARKPVELLRPDPRLLPLLRGVGIQTCGDLAALPREAVEVRLGSGGGALWKLARADDPRLLFRPIPPEKPAASMEFIDYSVTDAARLVFTTNALLGNVCGTLASRGERARQLTLQLSLASGGTLREALRAARPTADRATWLARAREFLERLSLPSPVEGLRLVAEATEPVGASQGDLFDRGFATAAAVEETVARLLDTQGPVFVRPAGRLHPLPESRTRWDPLEVDAVVSGPASPALPAAALRLQLLPEPRRVPVRVRVRREHLLPLRYRDQGVWREIVAAAGPDRLSGGHAEGALYAREYWRCETDQGRLVWLFLDAVQNAWYLHGWWE